MRKKRISLGVVFALMALTATLTLTLTYQYAMARFNEQVKNVTERQKMYAKLYQIDTRAREQFLYSIDENALNDAIANGYVEGLGDSRSAYLTQEACTQLQRQLSGKETGIGMEFTMVSGMAVVSRTIEGGPAQVAGVRKGDYIVRVGAYVVEDWTEGQIAEKLKGEAGTEVVITVMRVNEAGEAVEESYTITRKEYNMVTVESRMVGDTTGYLRIYTFNETTDEEFSDALASLVQAGATSLIIDVRNNGGGTLESAAKILDTLLPAGSIVSSSDTTGKKTVLYTSDATQTELPLVVLINENSASAAELVAAAVQDYDKGTVIGVQSFGKGTLQELYTFTDGSGLYLTTANFHPPLSMSFEKNGVTPDIKVEQENAGNLDLIAAGMDTQLSAAISKLMQEPGSGEPLLPEGTPNDGSSDNSDAEGSTSSTTIAYQTGCEDYTRS